MNAKMKISQKLLVIFPLYFRKDCSDKERTHVEKPNKKSRQNFENFILTYDVVVGINRCCERPANRSCKGLSVKPTRYRSISRYDRKLQCNQSIQKRSKFLQLLFQNPESPGVHILRSKHRILLFQPFKMLDLAFETSQNSGFHLTTVQNSGFCFCNRSKCWILFLQPCKNIGFRFCNRSKHLSLLLQPFKTSNCAFATVQNV